MDKDIKQQSAKKRPPGRLLTTHLRLDEHLSFNHLQPQTPYLLAIARAILTCEFEFGRPEMSTHFLDIRETA